MTRDKFLTTLSDKLTGLPAEDVEASLAYYAELLDDAVEDGMSEEDAMAQLGAVEDVAARILMDIPLSKVVKAKAKEKRTVSVGVILLLVLGAPLWITLLAAAFVILVAVYAVIWSAVISVWAVDVSLAATAVASLPGAVIIGVTQGNWMGAAFLLGAGLICGGLSLLLFAGCKKVTFGVCWLCRKMVYGVKLCFVGRRERK